MRRVPAQLGTAMLRELGMLPPHHLEPWNRCTRSPLRTLPLWGSCFSVKEKLQKRRWEEKRVSLGLSFLGKQHIAPETAPLLCWPLLPAVLKTLLLVPCCQVLPRGARPHACGTILLVTIRRGI